MIKATRRRFVALLGISATTGPLAVKAATDAEIMNLSGARVAAASLGSYVGNGPPVGGGDYGQSVIKASDYVRLMGIPASLDAQLRDNAGWVDRLDPDLACKRSWSMSVKFAAQRQRNYERAVIRMKDAGNHQRARSALKALLGFEWPL